MHSDTVLNKREIYVALAVLLIIALLNFSGIFLNHTYPINDSDNNWAFATVFYFAKHISSGQLPLWNNLFFTGKPFFDQEILAHPLNFLSLSLAGLLHLLKNPYFAFSLIIMAFFFLMGFFTYIVSRKVFGFSALASYFPAVIYMLNMGQQERVVMMPGGFLVAPLMILCAYKISDDRIIFYSVLCGLLQAIGFYFGSCMASGWSALIFLYFLLSFLIIKNGFSYRAFTRFIISSGVTFAVFALLAAAALLPFIINLPANYNLTARFTALDLTYAVNYEGIKNFFFDLFFNNLFGFNSSLSAGSYDFPLLTGSMVNSPLSKILFGGHWNYWSILFYPLFAFFIFNIKSFTKKERAIGFLIIIYFLHSFLLSFNHFLFLELKMLRGHNLLVKLHFIMQLVGGLFIGMVLNHIMRSWPLNRQGVKGLRIASLISYPILAIYAIINAFFLGGIALSIFSKEGLQSNLQKIILYLIEHIKGLSYVKIKYGSMVLDKIIYKAGFIINHFFSSEFTIKYVGIFISRLVIIFLFILLINSLIKHRRAPRKIYILISLILFFSLTDRINILKLYCPFNREAPKTFSEEYKEIRFLKDNLNNFQRVAVVTNDYESIARYIKNNLYMASDVEKNRADGFLNDDVFLNYWKEFPENRINGAPLMSVFNLPLGINTVNGAYTDVPPEIWQVYHQMNLKSDFYRHWIESLKGVSNGDLNCYSVESGLYDIMGVKYVLSSLPIQSKKLSFIFRGDKYLVYENRNAFPRIWITDKARLEKDDRKALEIIDGGAVDLKGTTLINVPLPFAIGQGALTYNAKIIQYKPDLIKINAYVNKRSLLVLSDTFLKDWHVYVNGAERKIERVNYFLRGVVLEPGRSDVIFIFRPYLFYLSCAISIFSFFLLTSYFIVQNRNRRKK